MQATKTWIFSQVANPRWASCVEKSSEERPQAFDCLVLHLKTAGFGSQKRLKTPQEYKTVFSNPETRSTSSYFKILAHPNEKLVARLGVIVAKKAIRKAVIRNRVKRLVRESFRMHQGLLKGLDIVVLLRKDIGQQVHHKSPTACLEQHWNALGL